MPDEESTGAAHAIENITPILRVESLDRSVEYYTGVLGFSEEWRESGMAGVSREGWSIMLCEGAQGNPGTWLWIGAHDAAVLYEELKASGATIFQEPANYPWAYEFKVSDLDGHVLRFGSEPLEDEPTAYT
jgi:catechol 2,3-dioxygenase-like lactoylglutathione lyase family enzyme